MRQQQQPSLTNCLSLGGIGFLGSVELNLSMPPRTALHDYSAMLLTRFPPVMPFVCFSQQMVTHFGNTLAPHPEPSSAMTTGNRSPLLHTPPTIVTGNQISKVWRENTHIVGPSPTSTFPITTIRLEEPGEGPEWDISSSLVS